MTPAALGGLPEDIVATLVKSVGAYIHAMPAQELPGHLRRYKSFRPKALLRHRSEMLAVLDDDIERRRILQWLDDDKPSLTKRWVEALRLACERPEGFEEQLAALSERLEPEPEAVRDHEAELERERRKARAAREELREAKAQARVSVEAERKRADELQRELTSLQADLQAARSEAAALKDALMQVREGAERDVRRARRAAESARGAGDATTDELKRARREIAALAAQVRELNAERERATGRTRSDRKAPEKEPLERTPLPVPGGLFDDDPETLDAWLGTSGVILLVDGYNVAKSEGGFGDLVLESQRARLVEEVDRLARRKGLRAIVVFDGSVVPPGTKRRPRAQVEVVYSHPDESADDRLVALLETLPRWPVVVVTSDRELQGRAGEKGATIATSAQLLALIR